MPSGFGFTRLELRGSAIDSGSGVGVKGVGATVASRGFLVVAEFGMCARFLRIASLTADVLKAKKAGRTPRPRVILLVQSNTFPLFRQPEKVDLDCSIK